MQNLILLITALIIAGLCWLVYKWPAGGMRYTFSQHAAHNKASFLYYISFFVVTLPLLLYFFATWFVPTLSLPTAFLWFAVVSILFQIICVLFPDNGGVNTIVHRTLTSVSALAMIPLVVIIATAPTIAVVARLVSWLVLSFMLATLCIALANQRGYKWAMLLQIAYYGAFLITIIAASYLR